MKLEIFNSGNRRVMLGDTMFCSYTEQNIKEMQSSGHWFKLDGKKATAKAVITAIINETRK